MFQIPFLPSEQQQKKEKKEMYFSVLYHGIRAHEGGKCGSFVYTVCTVCMYYKVISVFSGGC